MLNTEQLENIDHLLQAGYTPEQIAGQMGLSPTTLRYQLLKSGKQIVTFRRLENTAPVQTEALQLTA